MAQGRCENHTSKTAGKWRVQECASQKVDPVPISEWRIVLFEAHDLACQRGEQLLFAGLDFRVAAGEALILTGANGSGKSSLLRLAAGLMRPAAGDFLWQGRPIRHDVEQHRRRAVYLGHADALKSGLTVGENLGFWAALAGLAPAKAEAVVLAALEANCLASLNDLPVRFLSAGQRRRLTLSRLLLQPAEVAPLWLLDEPTTALDAAAHRRLINHMRAHLAAGGLILLASHDALETLPARHLAVDDFEPAPFETAPDHVLTDLEEVV